MGKLVITAEEGEGLYRGKLVHDTAALRAEKTRLELRNAIFWPLIFNALNSLDDLRREQREAEEGLHEVIQQWKDLLIDRFNEEPPALAPPDAMDPATGEPWVDQDRSQEGPLLNLVNALRSSPLTRVAALDATILRHLRFLAITGQPSHSAAGETVTYRTALDGYWYDPTVGVGQVLAYGTRTPESTLQTWMRRASDRGQLLNENFTECGVAFVYAPRNPYGYLWGLLMTAPGPEPATLEFPDNPAQTAANAAQDHLSKIEKLTIETFEPKKLQAVAAIYATAVQKMRVGEQAVVHIKAEQMARDARLAAIDALLAQDENQPTIAVWCASHTEVLTGTVTTMEVPGDWREDEKTLRTAVLYAGEERQKTVAYEERSLNIRPQAVASTVTGDLVYAEGMSDAAVAYNLAMEPGHLKWKPLWRYGTLTADAANDLCSLTLQSPNPARRLSICDGEDLPLDAVLTLTGVPIYYPPCHGAVFKAGDEVLILFEGQDRDRPKVIGFRREPKRCPASWIEFR